jgi:acyl dehydratase
MVLNRDIVGQRLGPVTRSWTSTDAIIYALGVGAGMSDPAAELSFTTENTEGQPQQALPTFAVVLCKHPELRPDLGVDLSAIVHAEQAVHLVEPVPVEGRAVITNTVTGIYDKGSGALVTSEAEARDADSDALLFTTSSAVMVRGAGGFGGDRGPSTPWAAPERPPDQVMTFATRPEQALLYRLSGDRNPLHSDPQFTRRAGFDRPIIHGLCLYGFVARELVHGFCGSDPARFESMSARFSRPSYPGDEIAVRAWDNGDDVIFQASTTADGSVVLDRGRFRLRTGCHV